MLKRVKFIYNTSSGENVIAEYLDSITELYQSYGYSIALHRLDFKGDPADAIADVDDGWDHILIAGGDGTINHIVNLMKSNGVNIPVGVLPVGTANDFATALGMSSDIMKACRQILSGEVRALDLGKVNDKYFVNVLSFGLFTDVSQKTPTILKNTFGKLAYYVNGINELAGFHKMDLSIKSDGGDFEGRALIALIFNGRTAGTLPLAYKSDLSDGFFDVLIVKSDNPLETVQIAIRYVVSYRGQKDYPRGIEHIKCTHLTADVKKPIPTDVDGQPGPQFPMEISCESGALRAILPPQRDKK